MTNLSGLETTPEVGDEKLGPAGAAALIADFVDVLIPAKGSGPRRVRSAFRASWRSG